MCICVCVCVCVSNTTKLQKDYIFKMSFFLLVGNSRFLLDWKKSHSQCILKKWMSAKPIHVVAIWRLLSHTGVSVFPLRRNCVKKERVFEDVFIENTCLGSGSKRRTKFTRGRSFTLVTWFSWPMVSRDWICVHPPIFVVGTSGIPSARKFRPTFGAISKTCIFYKYVVFKHSSSFYTNSSQRIHDLSSVWHSSYSSTGVKSKKKKKKNG